MNTTHIESKLQHILEKERPVQCEFFLLLTTQGLVWWQWHFVGCTICSMKWFVRYHLPSPTHPPTMNLQISLCVAWTWPCRRMQGHSGTSSALATTSPTSSGGACRGCCGGWNCKLPRRLWTSWRPTWWPAMTSSKRLSSSMLWNSREDRRGNRSCFVPKLLKIILLHCICCLASLTQHWCIGRRRRRRRRRSYSKSPSCCSSGF